MVTEITLPSFIILSIVVKIDMHTWVLDNVRREVT